MSTPISFTGPARITVLSVPCMPHDLCITMSNQILVMLAGLDTPINTVRSAGLVYCDEGSAELHSFPNMAIDHAGSRLDISGDASPANLAQASYVC